MIEIPEIFLDRHDEYRRLNDGSKILPAHWIEYISQIALLSEKDLPATYREFSKIDIDSCSDTVRAVYLTGQGRCLIRKGDFLAGAKLLGRAIKSVPNSSTDARAFILLEMVSFLGMIGSFELSRLILQQIPLLTRSEYLLKLSEYYTLVQCIRTGRTDVMEKLRASCEYFAEVNIPSVVAYHHKIAGNLLRRTGKYEQAENEYLTGIQISHNLRFHHITTAIRHDLAMLMFYMGNHREGIKMMVNCIEKAENKYTLAFIYANLGYIHLKKKMIDESLKWFKDSLEVITDHGIFHMIPGVCYYLGCIYEDRGKFRLAKYYYQQGNKAAHELLKQNFPFNGDRERAVSGYILFLEKHPGVSGDPLEDMDLSFAIDRTLKEIRGIFQNGMLTGLVKKYGTVRNSAKKMNMSERTFHDIRKRVQIYSPAAIPEDIIRIYLSQPEADWIQINYRFERIILKYLLIKYGNKRSASRVLKVSYPYLVSKTRKLDNSRFRKERNGQ